MRLFAAVLPPARETEELRCAVAGLRKLPGAAALRWADPGGWHFTLAFYGEVGKAGDAAKLCRRLGRAARRARPMTLRLGGGGRFGDRALWAGLGEESDRAALVRLAVAARRAGRCDEQGFRPHLTLARTRASAPVDLRPYVTELSRFEGSPWTVSELVLVRSHLPVSGTPGERPRYEPVERWRLGP
ncbi:RNA 2',3'-cyclic phosphodiesterase [Streptomyces iconiensis]|uniref:RNA 2',3'-cyclic phosphodiesterase n=1 Tax=Streptomyces iconiensis TaxID=1384038 RepID=A0ABT7ABD0_9ACTN|nr:RNA 2',3'-cyclic phosphodiesterase [Streptomyces iconiensis]MDJ1138131.1 RNA 2',3'-cyclic phosphodiesterase [Streptomyces iconiensis]